MIHVLVVEGHSVAIIPENDRKLEDDKINIVHFIHVRTSWQSDYTLIYRNFITFLIPPKACQQHIVNILLNFFGYELHCYFSY